MNDQDSSTFVVELFSEETNTARTMELKISGFPGTFLEIKEQIEKSFSIPVCVQTLHYQSHQVADTDVPSVLYVRSGDTFRVTYPIEGECEKVHEVIKWLRELVECLDRVKPETDEFDSDAYEEFESLLTKSFFEERANEFSQELVYPEFDKSKNVNKLHLQSLGAIPLAMTLYNHIVDAKKSTILEYGGLECVVSTLSTAHDSDAVSTAMYALCNFAEIPECQLKLAKRSNILMMALSNSTSPGYSYELALFSIFFYLCLAQCEEAHDHLLKPTLVRKLFEVCEKRKTEVEHFRAFQSYAGVVLAQMILGSPRLVPNLPKRLLQQTVDLMENIICKYSPTDISAYEDKEGITWSTFLPYIKFLYNPVQAAVSKPEIDSDLQMPRVREMSVEVLLYFLENALTKAEHVIILVKEGLVDYVVSLSWLVPEQTQVRVRNILQSVNKVVQIQPPRLCSLAKAKLAMSSLGLVQVLNAQSLADLLFQLSS